jgi:RNA polymerase sigma-70 factor (ECF subfamily)
MLNPSLNATIAADYAGLKALFARRIGNVAVAEDLVSEALLQSIEKLARDQIADPARFSGFVHGVAANLLRNHRRRMDNRIDLRACADALDSCAGPSSPEEDMQRQALAGALRRVVEALPVARDREIVRRFYFEEQSKAEVCAALQLSPTHFDKVLHRARGRVRVLLSTFNASSFI